LTISPDLLAQMQSAQSPVPRLLNEDTARTMDLPAIEFSQASFRLALNEDAMASEKLAEGIRAFCVDVRKLEVLMQA